MARSYCSAEDAAPPKIKTEGGRILRSLNRTVKRYATKIRTAAPLKILEMFLSPRYRCSNAHARLIRIGVCVSHLRHPIETSLFSADAETKSSTEVRRQRGITQDLVIVTVEGVSDVDIGGDTGSDGIPASEIDERIAGGMIDAEAVEVGIGTAANETGAQVCAPFCAEIIEHGSGGVTGTMKQGVSGSKRVGARRRESAGRVAEYLGGSVGISRAE